MFQPFFQTKNGIFQAKLRNIKLSNQRQKLHISLCELRQVLCFLKNEQKQNLAKMPVSAVHAQIDTEFTGKNQIGPNLFFKLAKNDSFKMSIEKI